MNISITINAASAEDARYQMEKLLGIGKQLPFTEVSTTGTTVGVAAQQPVQAGDVSVALAQGVAAVTEPPKPKGRKKAEAAPAAAEQAPTPTPEAAAQDVKDEAPATPAADATIDDVRAAGGVYIKKFGMPAAQEDVRNLFMGLFGEGCKTVRDIPNTPAAYAKAVAAVNEMVEKNPNKREPV